MVKSQHYIPRCVLKYFKESDEVLNRKHSRIYHVYHPRTKVYPSILAKTMTREYTYEVSSRKKNEIENLLGEYDKIYSDKLAILELRMKQYIQKDTKLKEVYMSLLDSMASMVLQHLRSGAMLFELGYNIKESRQDVRISRMIRRFQSTEYVSDFALALLKHYEISFIYSENGDFLISDQFICTAALSFKARFGDSTNRQIGQKDVIVFIPVSKHFYITFFDGNKPRYIKANQMCKLAKEDILEVNKIIMNNSYIETAGPSFRSLNDVVCDFAYELPTSVIYGGKGYSYGSDLRKELFFYDRDKAIWDFVSNPTSWSEFRTTKKNDICPCGSGKTFHECCRYKFRAFNEFMERVELGSEDKTYNPYSIPGCDFRERNILDFHTRG